MLIAMEVEFMALDFGCEVAGPADNVADALALARENRLEGAVLDVNLGSERIWPVAELLEEHSVPFVLATGYGDDEVPERFRARPILSKPLNREALASALRRIGIPANQPVGSTQSGRRGH